MPWKYVIESFHRAQGSYWCDECCSFIEIGDIYRRSVIADNRKHLTIMKKHYDPPCPYDREEEEEEFNRRMDELVEELDTLEAGGDEQLDEAA